MTRKGQQFRRRLTRVGDENVGRVLIADWASLIPTPVKFVCHTPWVLEIRSTYPSMEYRVPRPVRACRMFKSRPSIRALCRIHSSHAIDFLLKFTREWYPFGGGLAMGLETNCSFLTWRPNCSRGIQHPRYIMIVRPSNRRWGSHRSSSPSWTRILPSSGRNLVLNTSMHSDVMVQDWKASTPCPRLRSWHTREDFWTLDRRVGECLHRSCSIPTFLCENQRRLHWPPAVELFSASTVMPSGT